MFKDRPDRGRGARSPRRLRHARLAGRQGRRDPGARGPHHRLLAEGRGGRGRRPAFPYTLTERDRVWANNVAILYEQATAAQWDASTDIRWHDLARLPTHVERAVAQIMTHLAENEYAALYVPARFIPRVHPHFTEVALFLSHPGRDEARHIEAFTKRALANGGGLVLHGEDPVVAQVAPRAGGLLPGSFLLSVLGEGTFLDYLAFVERFAPDPVTADIVRRARIDEARHVAFGVEHARHYLAADPDRAGVFRGAVGSGPRSCRRSSARPRTWRRRSWCSPPAGSGPARSARVSRRARVARDDASPSRRPAAIRSASTTSTAEEISELHTSNFM